MAKIKRAYISYVEKNYAAEINRANISYAKKKLRENFPIYKNTPMDELKWLEREGGNILESCYISLKNTPTSHAVSLALGMYPMPLLSCACLCNNSTYHNYMPLFGSSSSFTGLLLLAYTRTCRTLWGRAWASSKLLIYYFVMVQYLSLSPHQR